MRRSLPDGWIETPLRHCAREPIRNGVGAPAEEDREDWPRYIRITDIDGPRTLRPDTFKSLAPSEARKATVNVGDLLLAAVGATFGKSYLHSVDIGPACYAGYLVKVSPKSEVDGRFLAYWTESQHYWDQVESRVIQATIQNFSAGKYRQLVVPLPPREGQGEIADFLDEKTAAIDVLIAKKERLINLIEEKRQAAITRAVTKGLDPDVPMKDSGVEWLGEVPAHWAVARLKHISRIFGRIGFRGYRTEDLVGPGEGALTLGGKHLSDHGRLDLSEPTYLSWEKFYESPEISLQPGDLLVAQRGSVGRTALVPPGIGPATVNPSLVRVADVRIDSKFLSVFLRSESAQRYFDCMRSATAVPMLSQEQIGSLPVCVPPDEEQVAIRQWVHEETALFDSLAGALHRQMVVLAQYRQSLISAAVTGHIDVRSRSIRTGEVLQEALA